MSSQAKGGNWLSTIEKLTFEGCLGILLLSTHLLRTCYFLKFLYVFIGSSHIHIPSMNLLFELEL
jgi:hypothetical protein